jgi:8-oxo-dGTP pyrophosphatase MutT (NUDIX family)
MDKNINESDFEWTDSVSSDPLQWVQPDITLDNVEKENLTEGFYYKGVNPTVDLIVIRGDKVLLIQRGDDSEVEAGKWALPGGFHDTNAKEGEEWKEDKESSLDAAKREVKEETGLDVDSISGLNFEMVGGETQEIKKMLGLEVLCIWYTFLRTKVMK